MAGNGGWQNETLVTVLATPGQPYEGRGKRCAARAAAAGFPHVRLHVGTNFIEDAKARGEPRPSATRVSTLIMRAHWKALRGAYEAAQAAARTPRYLLMLEDDCTFVDAGTLRARTAYALDSAFRATPDWPLLLLGFVNLTPYLPQRGPLVRLPSPWGAHAILYRTAEVPKLLRRPPTRGQVIEGWAALPLRHRLGVSPCVAFQETMPRESPVKGDFRAITTAWHVGVNTLPLLLVLALCVVLLVTAARWRGGGAGAT